MMNRVEQVKSILTKEVDIKENYVDLSQTTSHDNQSQVNKVFSNKWKDYDSSDEKEKLYAMQRDWYLSLYGFTDEEGLKKYLESKKVIFDAGCGLGYKAAWFAELAPHALVIGMDYSDAAEIASKQYSHIENLFFCKGDIAKTFFKSESVDYVSCDQVIMHTEDPEITFSELTRITKNSGEFACYVYAKKALPRELLDDYFRIKCKTLTHEELKSLSVQLTDLGKILTELEVEIDVPDIPLLDIKGGKYDLQRFIYWNFIKCFWNVDLGYDTSVITNYDWYSPSNAKRYSRKEFESMVDKNNLETVYFHEEEACYSGRFRK